MATRYLREGEHGPMGGYGGTGLSLSHVPATRSMLSRLAQHDAALARRLDEAAFRACLGGRGGPALSAGDVSRAIAGDTSLVEELVDSAVRLGELVEVS